MIAKPSYSKIEVYGKRLNLDQTRNFSSHKLVLPSIGSRIGSLNSFLSMEEFKKGLPDDFKYQDDYQIRKKTRKVYLTMNEELSSATKKEVSSRLTGQEDQGDSGDERKKLLYDKHVINRQKAAINICRSIVDDVKQKFGYLDALEESDKTEIKSDESKLDGFDISKLIRKTKNCNDLREKIAKMSEMIERCLKLPKKIKRQTKFPDRLIPREQDDLMSYESSGLRHSRTKEKGLKEKYFQTAGNLSELFYQQNFNIKTQYENPAEVFDYLSNCIETKNSNQKTDQIKKFYVSINRTCISLPDSKITAKVCTYILNYYTNFHTLLKINFSKNSIGDKALSLFIHHLKDINSILEILDCSSTNIGLLTSESLEMFLSAPAVRLLSLKIGNNPLKDQGICNVAIGLLKNTTVNFLDVSECGIELAAGYAIAKVLRINRSLKAIVMARNQVAGKANRELTRSLIVNNELISLNLGECQLDDEDTKELAHMLNSNKKLQQLVISKNKITHKGLEYFKYGLIKNKALVHLGLSGNPDIKLKEIEKLKDALSKNIEIDISKEEDFFKSSEAKKYKLTEYIR
jgi:hypothetical protein